MKPEGTTRPIRLLLVGFGPVGRAFAELLEERSSLLRARGLDLSIVAVATSRGVWGATAAGGVTPADLARRVAAGTPFADLPRAERDAAGLDAIASVEADVLVEATPTNLADGEPATSHLRAALSRGWSVVTASKGALLHHAAEFRALAAQHGGRLRYGAATAAALPTLDLIEFGLAGATVERIEGVLNGTSNYVLTLMRRDGVAFEDALREAQARGIAEADPTLDVDGWDTAAKLVLIGNAAWDADLTLADVERTGIRGVDAAAMAAATADGTTIRLVGSLWRDADGRPRGRVAPEALGPNHPLAHVDGAEKGATFTTDTLGSITVTGGASSPRGAAAALLRDVINLAQVSAD